MHQKGKAVVVIQECYRSTPAKLDDKFEWIYKMRGARSACPNAYAA